MITEKVNHITIENACKIEAIHYVYILLCGDDSLYTGWTMDLPARLKAHNDGSGAKYTRSRLPVTLVYFETFEERSEALKREHAIKKLTRSQKLSLISLSGSKTPTTIDGDGIKSWSKS